MISISRKSFHKVILTENMLSLARILVAFSLGLRPEVVLGLAAAATTI